MIISQVMKTRFTRLAAVSALVVSGQVHAVPSVISHPVNLSYSNSKFCASISSQCTNGWSFWQHRGGYHRSGGGIGGANDYYAWDVNLNSPTWNYDAGKPVLAVESGWIHTGNSWGGSSAGQLLINHTTGSDKWSSGYLHMSNFTSKKARCAQRYNYQNCYVRRGEIIGYISHVGETNNDHLHFAVYNTHGKSGMRSVNVAFNSGSTSATLSSIRVYCPSSVSENSSSAGSCSAKAYYSNGTNKDVTNSASWSDNSSALRVYSNGRLKTYSVSRDVNVTISARYRSGGVTEYATATVRVKNGGGSSGGGTALDGKDPHATGCDRDGRTVAYKSMSYGNVELRWSNSCKTNWTRVKANSSSYSTKAYLWRSSDRKYQIKSGRGTIWTPMFYAPNITACAYGIIKGKGSGWTCR